MKQQSRKLTNQAAQTSAEPDGAGMEASSAAARAEAATARPMSKTPMFTAMHSARYQRQAIMRELDRERKSNLICYVSGDHREVERNDVIGFVDLLHNIPTGASVDLMLHTMGGDVDVAQKLIELIHVRIQGSGRFRVIVPDFAKSAGTLMALGADSIVMSDTSELGMIDPQFWHKDEKDNDICTSVVASIEAHREHMAAVRKDPNDQAALTMLSKFDPIIVRKFQGYRDRTRDIAMRMLDRQGAAATTISEALLDLSKWKSHGQMIGHDDARLLGLKVEYLPPDHNDWQLYWQLYCLQRLEVQKDKKIFESSFVSQVFET